MPNHIKVIKFGQHRPNSGGWRFFDFVENGKSAVDDWFHEMSEVGRQRFTSMLKDASRIESPSNWIGLRMLIREHRIWELRFHADGKAQRALLIFSEIERQACILLAGCYHKGSVYVPADVKNTAIRRAQEYRRRAAEGRGRAGEVIRERQIRDDL